MNETSLIKDKGSSKDSNNGDRGGLDRNRPSLDWITICYRMGDHPLFIHFDNLQPKLK